MFIYDNVVILSSMWSILRLEHAHGLKRYNDRRMTRGQTTCSLEVPLALDTFTLFHSLSFSKINSHFEKKLPFSKTNLSFSKNKLPFFKNLPFKKDKLPFSKRKLLFSKNKLQFLKNKLQFSKNKLSFSRKTLIFEKPSY